MENISLTDVQDRTHVFQQAVFTGLRYWQTWLADKRADSAAVDRERTVIVRTLSFALDLETRAWPPARTLIEIVSPYMERRGHWEMWQHILRRATTVAERAGDESGVVNLSALLARLSFRQSRFKEAIKYYRRAIRVARQIGDQFNEARACTNLGYYYAEKAYWRRSEVLCCHALELFEQLDNAHGQAHTENHLGFLYTRQHQWKPARQHLEQACTIWQTMGDEHGLMQGYINLGLLYLRMEQFDLAMSYLEKAIHQAEVTGEETAIGTIYMNMGLVNTLSGDCIKGEEYAREAETIFQQFGNSVGLAQVWDNLGMACLYQGKQFEALTYLEASLEAWRALNNKQGEMETLADLVEYQIITGERSLAQKQLTDLEAMLNQYNQNGAYDYLQTTLKKHRRSLTEDSPEQATAS